LYRPGILSACPRRSGAFTLRPLRDAISLGRVSCSRAILHSESPACTTYTVERTTAAGAADLGVADPGVAAGRAAEPSRTAATALRAGVERRTTVRDWDLTRIGTRIVRPI
jgi:hypothetical protein